jgi:hypothetical protein
MKKTLIGLAVCGLMLTTLLPISALATTPSSTGMFGRSTVRGFALYLGMDPTGRTTHLFALRLHYTTISITGEHGSGVIRMRPVDIPTKVNGFHGRLYISASFRGTIDV